MKLRAALVTIIAVVIAAPIAAQRPAVGNPLPVPGRSMVITKYGIVAASQPLAARAGVEMLEHGGNAIDAAIAAKCGDGADGTGDERRRR